MLISFTVDITTDRPIGLRALSPTLNEVAVSRDRRRRLRHELAIRGALSLIIIVFHVVFSGGVGGPAGEILLATALVGLLLNGPYYLAARAGHWSRSQAYGRMTIDVLLITFGLYSAGGLSAARYLAIYLIVPIYTGIVFSSAACLVATATATASYGGIVILQQIGVLTPPAQAPEDAVMVAAFNLTILNVGGVLTALLARALRESRRRLRAMYQDLARFMEAIPDVLFVLDRDGRLTLWNRRLETATGLAANVLAGRPLAELLVDADREGMRQALARRLALGRFEVESRLQSADGAPVPYQWTGAALIDEQGRPSGFTGVGRDVTERNRAAEELRQLQRIEAVGQLAGGVAHDFNNLLTVILGRCQLLQDRRADDRPLAQDLSIIAGTAERAANLTRQLLAFSRKQTLERRVLDVNRIVTDIASMLRRLIGEHIELMTTLQPGLRVAGDPGQLEQVIVNLAVNAKDAMPGGGRLTIETFDAELDSRFVAAHPGAAPGQHVVLRVTDTGIGMDVETRVRVFEPFFTTKAKDKGTGLGLATVYGIVKQHGGHITVESEPGRGACFTVYLPAVDLPLPPELTRATDVLAPTAGETVLLVEDSTGVRGLAEEALSGLGYAVLAAANAEEALALCERHTGRIDLLLTDIVMPGINGLELAERVKILRPEAAVLLMTGYTDVRVDPAILLQKPFTLDALARRVSEILRGARRGSPEDAPGGGCLVATTSAGDRARAGSCRPD